MRTEGAQSTEFLLAVGGIAAGLALVVAGLVLSRDVAVAAGALQQCAVAIGYALGRSRHKAAKDQPRPYLPPVARP